MLTREQIEEILGEAPGERDSNQGPVEIERHSRAPVLLVEAEVRQGRGSGWVPAHSWRRLVDTIQGIIDDPRRRLQRRLRLCSSGREHIAGNRQ